MAGICSVNLDNDALIGLVGNSAAIPRPAARGAASGTHSTGWLLLVRKNNGRSPDQIIPTPYRQASPTGSDGEIESMIG